MVLGLAGAARAEEQGVWLVLTRDMFVDTLAPLQAHRRQQGFQTVISTACPAEAIAAHASNLRYILLVGDELNTNGDPSALAAAADSPWRMPSRRYAAVCWHDGQKESFASDVSWGDLNGDGAMDVPVGRLPVRTTEQLQGIIEKILRYERRGPRLGDLTFPLWTGKAEYGETIDRFTTTVLLENLNSLAPRWCQPWVISANETHALCGWPFDQAEEFAGKVQKEGALSALMGHGRRNHFYSMIYDKASICFDVRQARQYWSEGDVASPLIIIACYCGDFTGAQECLAETALNAPGGPVAVIAGTGETHPLTNLYGGQVLLGQLGQDHQRLGDFWRAVQQQTAQTRLPLAELLLAEIEGQFKEPEGIEKVRRDHQLIYNLLGDPATRLYLPGKLHGRIDREGDGWRWRVDKPEDATCLQVDRRQAEPAFLPGASILKATEARRRFQEANAGFAFESAGRYNADQEWTGCVKEPGVLRFVAASKERFYTAAVVLMPSNQKN